jgi:ABC-type uncharacterized transport system permease subunit
MPIFAAFFGALFTALSGFLLKIFVAKVTIRLAAVAALTGLATALLATFNGFVAPLVAQVFSNPYGQFLGLLFPPIAGTIITTLLTFYLAVKAYRIQARAISLTAGV